MLLSRARNVARKPLRSLRLEIFYFCHTSIFYATSIGIMMFPSSSLWMRRNVPSIRKREIRRSLRKSRKSVFLSFPNPAIRSDLWLGRWIRRTHPCYLSPKRPDRNLLAGIVLRKNATRKCRFPWRERCFIGGECLLHA